MNIETFLARVVGPGGYLAIAFKDPTREGGMGHRYFDRNKLRDAIGFLNWTYEKATSDAYFGLAGFSSSIGVHVDDKGKPLAHGLRTAANAEALAAFWLDLDVARPGDGKDPTRVYSDRRAAMTWLFTFCRDAQLPQPNIVVNSGYGYHVYWTLAGGMSRADWQPYADALKYAIHQHGYIGDLQRVADAASILRPIGSINRKGGGAAPVEIVPGSIKDDYPVDIMCAALQPYLGKGATTTVVATQALTLGAMPAFMQGAQLPNMAVAAQAGVQMRQPSSFAKIATQCLQVQASLADHGRYDSRPIWYLGHLSLAHHCDDGAAWAHEIGNGHPEYSLAGTDAMIAQVAREKAIKDTGPPRCASYDSDRPGICGQCPFNGKVKSPWELGRPPVVRVSVNDMPPHYRRDNGWIQHNALMDGGERKWVNVTVGDVFNPTLDKLTKGYAINFTYEYAGKKFPVRAEPDMPSETGAMVRYFNEQHMALRDHTAKRFREFIMAWIDHMRSANLERDEIIRPFGYSVNKLGERTGLAVAGTLYRPDGTTEPAAGGDPRINASYTPHGVATPWRQVFDHVCDGRVELQAIVSTAFAAPLMQFTGENGLVVSSYSQSGGAKSAAMKIAHAVWGDHTQFVALNPTGNSVIQKLGLLKVLPYYWDELSWAADGAKLTEVVMNVSQGVGKARLDSNMNQREVLTWATIVCVAGNQPIASMIESASSFTDAAALRLFEFHAPKITTVVPTVVVSNLLRQLETNYGHTGAQYAAYVAANLPAIEKIVAKIITDLSVQWEAKTQERLYFAGVGAMLAGAIIANKIGVAKFDIVALKTFFKSVIDRSREAREGLVANDKGYDVGRVLAEFQTAHTGNILVTKKFIKRGPRPKDWGTPYRMPGPGAQPCYIHYSVEDLRLWINKGQLTEWLRRKGYAPSQVLGDMKRAWDTVENKRIIGGGTNWGVGQLPTIEIPVDSPQMANFIPAFEISNEQVAKLNLPIPEDDPADALPEMTETSEAA